MVGEVSQIRACVGDHVELPPSPDIRYVAFCDPSVVAQRLARRLRLERRQIGLAA
jgi:hypothetical protein